MKLKELLSSIGYDEIIPNSTPDTEINIATSVSMCDEYSILFITPRVSGGYSVNINDLSIKPLLIISDSDFPDTPGIYTIRLINPRAALALAYQAYYGIKNGDLTLIAVTGTNGKTSTATLIYDILEGDGIKVGFIGTGLVKYGTHILSGEHYSMTTPDPDFLYSILAKMKGGGCTAVVMEASSHSIALSKLVGLIFDIAVFTNLSGEHLDFHSDIEEYFRVKASLFENTKRAIINIDDEYGSRLYNLYKEKSLSVGIMNKADIYATDIELEGVDGSTFFYRTKKLISKIKTRLVGAFNVYNILMAMAAAIEFGIAPCIAKRIINEHGAIRGRCDVVWKKPLVVIDYAHTPFALENALKSLYSKFISKQSIICLVGCGGERDTKKRPEVARIATKYARHTVICEDNSRGEPFEKIAAEILSGAPDNKCITVIEDRKSAIRHALSLAGENDIVAIIGKGHEEYIIDKNGKRHFSERAIIREYFEGLGRNEN